MFIRPYRALQKKREEMLANFRTKRQAISQPITIREISVVSSSEFGEYDRVVIGESALNVPERIINHVKLFGNIANKYHEEYYCEHDNSSMLKRNCMNSITRLSLCDYSLFTNEPLTLAEFAVIKAGIEENASMLHANVHLALGSMAVRGKDGIVKNVALYVQGGLTPDVRTLVKDMKSERGRKSRLPHYDGNEVSPDQSILTYNEWIDIKTAGGAKYTQAIEVSVKHDDCQIDTSEDDDISPAPEQVDHLVLANKANQKLARLTQHHPYFAGKRTMLTQFAGSDKIEVSDIDRPDDTEDISITKTKNRLVIHNPFFGSHCEVIPKKERKVDHYSKRYAKKIHIHNENIIPEKIRKANEFDLYHEANKLKNKHMDEVLMSLPALMKHYKIGVIERIFNFPLCRSKSRCQTHIRFAGKQIRALDMNDINVFGDVKAILETLSLRLMTEDLNPDNGKWPLQTSGISFIKKICQRFDDGIQKLSENQQLVTPKK